MTQTHLPGCSNSSKWKIFFFFLKKDTFHCNKYVILIKKKYIKYLLKEQKLEVNDQWVGLAYFGKGRASKIFQRAQI